MLRPFGLQRGWTRHGAAPSLIRTPTHSRRHPDQLPETTMRLPVAKIVLCVLAVIVAVPESTARRLGSGRSIGRQGPVYRQPAAPAYQQRQATPASPPAPVAPPRQMPEIARQAGPMPAPARANTVRPAGGMPWGGMIGGALAGLGLGSMLSSHGGNTNNLPSNRGDGSIDPQAPGQTGASNGANGSGTTASGSGQAVAPEAQQSRAGFGSLLMWGLLALAGFVLFRRLRASSARRP